MRFFGHGGPRLAVFPFMRIHYPASVPLEMHRRAESADCPCGAGLRPASEVDTNLRGHGVPAPLWLGACSQCSDAPQPRMARKTGRDGFPSYVGLAMPRQCKAPSCRRTPRAPRTGVIVPAHPLHLRASARAIFLSRSKASGRAARVRSARTDARRQCRSPAAARLRNRPRPPFRRRMSSAALGRPGHRLSFGLAYDVRTDGHKDRKPL